jgi:hypothetical protein
MSKRRAEKERESKKENKKVKRENKQTKWRAKFLLYNNPRIKEAVAASLEKQLPIILVKDCPSLFAAYYKFWPKNQEIGERVLNLLECTYNYGHTEENEEDTEDDFAGSDHIKLVETLCGGSKKDSNEHDLVSLYFHTTVDQIGRIQAEDDFSELPPLLYFQPCYGYY